MKRQNKQIAIYNAAIRCIGKYGVEKTNAQSIARELGIAPSGIFYYFPKQDQIFDSLVAYIAEINHTIVSELLQKRKPKTHWERLLIHVEGNLLWVKKYPDQMAVLLLSVVKTGRSRTMRERIGRLMSIGEERLYTHLTAGVAEREFAVEGEIRSMASFLHKALIGMTVSYHYSRKSVSISHYLDLAKFHFRQNLLFPD